MRKIILFLALALGVKVNAQIVGGYLPINSSKSGTVGALRTNSLVVTASTISVGAKTLTAGNTGTVAVLSDALFALHLQHGSVNPADGTTYYYGNTPFALSTNTTLGQVTLPYNCTLVGWNLNIVTGSQGTSETSTVSITGTTNYTLSSSITMSTTTGVNNFSGTGLNQSFSAGDILHIKVVTPTWATNPTGVVNGTTLWFVRRS